MNKDSSRVVLISLSVVCFILFYSTVAFYVMEETEKSKKIVAQKKLVEVTTEKQSLDSKLNEAEALMVELKTRLSTQEATIAEMTQRLDEERKANTNNMLKLKSRGNEIRGMKSKIINIEMEKEELIKKIAKLTEDYQNIKSQVENTAKTREDTEKKSKETMEREGVSLGTIVVDHKAQ